MNAGSIRARVRAEMIEEIKTVARRHLATSGANLSLRAVARDMGMVSSALYRYFANRDDLLTALIIDAYHDLGDAVEQADQAVGDRGDLRARWLAMGHGVRRWGLANPAEYALIFGSPVPGYAAPQATVEAAGRTPAALVQVFIDGHATGRLAAPDVAELPPEVAADLRQLREEAFPALPETLLSRAMIGWTHLFGAVSFELFGQLNNVVAAREPYFDHHLNQVADLMGLPAAGGTGDG